MSDFLRRPGLKGSKSRRQEKRLAKELNGFTTPGSGSGSMKGDVRTTEDMVEAKTTSKTQFTLKLETLRKLEVEAAAVGKRPVLVIQIDDDSPLFFLHPEWVVLPKHDYLALKEPHE